MNHFQRLVRSAAVLWMAFGGPVLLGSGLAVAQAVYPNKPLRLVVTFPTGGAPDILARLFSEKAQLGQSVVVDNTNTTVAEVSPYAALALAYGHTLKIMTFVGDWRIAARRNVHGVSEATVESQANRTGEAMFPPWWPHETVEIR